ncbi:MAG: type II toxin-antitoxin system Phd/YefM family antitoxin [Pseudomonadota bacterium]|nr:type II toxin-antitoxin system Phd/YefM family antitoxin [Pseudomonadota bacterium]
MQTVTLTALRQNIFHLADQVLETGEPVVIERNGRHLLLVPERPKIDWDKLPRRNAIVGDPEELVELSGWNEAEWHELENLDGSGA